MELSKSGASNFIATAGRSDTIDDPFRHEKAIIDRLGKYFVGIYVIAVPKSGRGTPLRLEIETRVDQVLTVREEELHAAVRRPVR
jgi:hypothetical protein